MNYPDGRMMQAGDLVWWNEGVCVGYIEEVIGTQDEWALWGLSEPSYAVSNLHPFEACSTKHKQHVGGVVTGGTVVYPETHMEDDGLGLLDDKEREELRWARTSVGRTGTSTSSTPSANRSRRSSFRCGPAPDLHFPGTASAPFQPVSDLPR